MASEIPEYPPLAATDVYPLHPEGVYPPDFVWACSEPERPRSRRTAYDWRCAPCVIAAQAHVANQGDETVSWTPTSGAEPRDVLQSWLIARSLYWRNPMIQGDG